MLPVKVLFLVLATTGSVLSLFLFRDSACLFLIPLGVLLAVDLAWPGVWIRGLQKLTGKD
jgi:hypothetical protein